jgi:GPI mannosyltransferase 3
MINLKKYLIGPLFFAFDLLIALSCLIVSYILLTGGGEFYAGNTYIRFNSSRNLLILLFILLPIRFFAGRHVPALLIKKWDLRKLPQKLLDYVSDLFRRLESLRKEDVIKLLAAIIFVSTVVKILNAWLYYGFFSGDDVEVFEMTLAHLYEWKWQAWNLRSAFYPMVFIAPIHFVLKTIGVTSPGMFVFAGRIVVVVFSVFNILLVYQIVRRLLQSSAPGLIAAFLLAFSQLHISFAASILPRTVASTFILYALYLLIRKPQSSLYASLAGIFLGTGAVIRFSEAIFIVPCLIYLIMEKRFRHALWVSLTSLLTGLALLGLSDYLYWGSPLFSLKNIVDYTLVKKLSSRGYQSPIYYITHIGEWSNGLMVILALMAYRGKKHVFTIWALSPLLLLSLLPHKESRYLIPVIPFFAAMAGTGTWYWLKDIARNPSIQVSRKQMMAMLLSFAFIGSLVFEADRFRFRRSETAVDIARYLTAQNKFQSIAIEQLWRTGGEIYLHKIPKVLNISPDSISDRSYFIKIIDTPGLQMVALKKIDAVKYHYDDLLIEKGFQEFHIPQRGNGKYRLFKKI